MGDVTPVMGHDERPEYFRVLTENAGLREENAWLRSFIDRLIDGIDGEGMKGWAVDLRRELKARDRRDAS